MIAKQDCSGIKGEYLVQQANEQLTAAVREAESVSWRFLHLDLDLFFAEKEYECTWKTC